MAVRIARATSTFTWGERGRVLPLEALRVDTTTMEGPDYDALYAPRIIVTPLTEEQRDIARQRSTPTDRNHRKEEMLTAQTKHGARVLLETKRHWQVLAARLTRLPAPTLAKPA